AAGPAPALRHRPGSWRPSPASFQHQFNLPRESQGKPNLGCRQLALRVVLGALSPGPQPRQPITDPFSHYGTEPFLIQVVPRHAMKLLVTGIRACFRGNRVTRFGKRGG